MTKYLLLVLAAVLMSGCATARPGVLIAGIAAGTVLLLSASSDDDDDNGQSAQQCHFVIGGDGRGGTTSTQVCR